MKGWGLLRQVRVFHEKSIQNSPDIERLHDHQPSPYGIHFDLAHCVPPLNLLHSCRRRDVSSRLFKFQNRIVQFFQPIHDLLPVERLAPWTSLLVENVDSTRLGLVA